MEGRNLFTKVIQFLFSMCLLASLGCGYSFQGSGSVLPPDVKRIQIPLVHNNSTEPGLDQIVTEALIDRFERFGVVTIVDTLEEADAVLYAQILDLDEETATVTSNTDTALQKDTTLIVSGELRRVTGPVLWRNNGVAAVSSFGSTSDVIVTSSSGFAGASLGAADLARLDAREASRSQEQEVVNDLAEKIAKKIYDEAVAPEF